MGRRFRPGRKMILGTAWILGVLVFAFLVAKIGPARVWEHLRRLTLPSPRA